MKIKNETPPHKRKSVISTDKMLDKMEINHRIIQKRIRKIRSNRFGMAVNKFIKEKYFNNESE